MVQKHFLTEWPKLSKMAKAKSVEVMQLRFSYLFKRPHFIFHQNKLFCWGSNVTKPAFQKLAPIKCQDWLSFSEKETFISNQPRRNATVVWTELCYLDSRSALMEVLSSVTKYGLDIFFKSKVVNDTFWGFMVDFIWFWQVIIKGIDKFGNIWLIQSGHTGTGVSFKIEILTKCNTENSSFHVRAVP